MTTLVLRVAGPLQSWGGYRHGSSIAYTTPTAAMPRKSAISGLVGAALGTRDLAGLPEYKLHVRLDAGNPPVDDFQTLGPLSGWLSTKEIGEATVHFNRWQKLATATTSGENMPTSRNGGNMTRGVTTKQYLPHSEFMVALETDQQTAATWLSAFRDPVFPLYFGRASCGPSFPFVLGLWEGGVQDLYESLPWVSAQADPHMRSRPKAELRGYEIQGNYDSHIEARHFHADNPDHHRLYKPDTNTRKEQLEWASQQLSR